jgi:hypothetical protein
MLRTMKGFLADERGQASTEYAVIIGVIAVGSYWSFRLAFRGKVVSRYLRRGWRSI